MDPRARASIEAEAREGLVREGVPEHLHRGLLAYVLQGHQPGHFLTAVLENDFMEAIGRADDECMRALGSIAKYLYNWTPSPCWGSPEHVRIWCDARAEERRAMAPDVHLDSEMEDRLSGGGGGEVEP